MLFDEVSTAIPELSMPIAEIGADAIRDHERRRVEFVEALGRAINDCMALRDASGERTGYVT